MAGPNREFGVVGLGRMGGNLAHQALEKGHRVVGFELKGAPQELLEAGLKAVEGLEGFRKELMPPRVLFIYIPAGPIVDKVLDDLASRLGPGDVVVDGGNSYWGDSIRRHRRLMEKKIHLVDLGTSGGVSGARGGACFMVGGGEGGCEGGGADPAQPGDPRRLRPCRAAGGGPFHEAGPQRH